MHESYGACARAATAARLHCRSPLACVRDLLASRRGNRPARQSSDRPVPADEAPGTSAADSVAPEPFALGSPPSALDAIREKWSQVRDEVAQDAIVLAGCRSVPQTCPTAARRFLALIDSAKGKDGRALLGEINRAVNLAIRNVSDLKQHGTDVWSSPLATFASGQGDCEDYAIAKYLALRESGIATENLRLVVVQSRRGSAHAVLAVRLDDRWLLLDNTTLVLVPDHERTDYRPLIAFGAEADLTTVETALVDGPSPARCGAR